MIEIRTFDGDSREAAAFTASVWTGAYGGHHQIPLWDERYYEWQLFGRADVDRSLDVAAYESGKLVGTLFAEPFRFRFGNREREGSMSSWLTVDPRMKGKSVGRQLADELRRRHRERGLAFAIGFVIPGTQGRDFWGSMPDTIFFGKLGYWVRVLDRRAVASWLRGGERLAAVLLGPLVAPLGRDQSIPGVRPFAAADLDRCLELTRPLTEGSEIGHLWTRSRLLHQLSFGQTPQTLVYERDGSVRGFLNYYAMDFLLRGPLRIAHVDVIAAGELDGIEQGDLIGAALARMKVEGVALAVVPRMAACPSAALARNRFVPLPANMTVTCVLAAADVPRRRLRRYQLLVR